MLRKALIIAALVLLAFLGGSLVVDWLRTDEERVFLVLARMADGFNDGSPADAVEGFAATFRDPDHGLAKAQIQAALAYAKRERDDPGFAWTIELDRSRTDVSVAGERATVRGPARFVARKDGAEVWSLTFDASLSKLDGEWRVVEIATETVEGSPPF